MQLLIDLLPVIIFFVAYKVAGMYVATAAIIAAMGIQLAIQWFPNSVEPETIERPRS